MNAPNPLKVLAQQPRWLDDVADDIEQLGRDNAELYVPTREQASRLRGHARLLRQTVLEMPRGTTVMAAEDDTVLLIPLREFIDLAKLVKAMRDAQRKYFKTLDRKRGIFAEPELAAAKFAEGRVDLAVQAAIDRERQPALPGMEMEGSTPEEGGDS